MKSNHFIRNFLAAFCVFVGATNVLNSAGILPYYLDSQGRAWFLLGLEHRPREGLRWLHFAGQKEGTETPPQTAIREIKEETGGYLTPAKFSDDLNRLNQLPTLDYVSTSRRGINWLARLATKVNPADIENAAKAKGWSVAHPGRGNIEKIEWKWFTYDELMQSARRDSSLSSSRAKPGQSFKLTSFFRDMLNNRETQRNLQDIARRVAPRRTAAAAAAAAAAPAPRVRPPAPRVAPPAPRPTPVPRVRPPAPRVRPPAPRVAPPAPRVRPPAPRVAPPAPRVTPPAPRVAPPAPRPTPAVPPSWAPAALPAAPVPDFPGRFDFPGRVHRETVQNVFIKAPPGRFPEMKRALEFFASANNFRLRPVLFMGMVFMQFSTNFLAVADTLLERYVPLNQENRALSRSPIRTDFSHFDFLEDRAKAAYFLSAYFTPHATLQEFRNQIRAEIRGALINKLGYVEHEYQDTEGKSWFVYVDNAGAFVCRLQRDFTPLMTLTRLDRRIDVTPMPIPPFEIHKLIWEKGAEADIEVPFFGARRPAPRPVLPAPRVAPAVAPAAAPAAMPRAPYATIAEFVLDTNPHPPTSEEARRLAINFEGFYVDAGVIEGWIKYDDLRNEDGSRLTPGQKQSIINYLEHKRTSAVKHFDNQGFRFLNSNPEVLENLPAPAQPNTLWRYVHRYLRSRPGFLDAARSQASPRFVSRPPAPPAPPRVTTEQAQRMISWLQDRYMQIYYMRPSEEREAQLSILWGDISDEQQKGYPSRQQADLRELLDRVTKDLSA